jgi:hypothetical protein
VSKPAPKPGILRNLRIKRVDLVDAGANFDASTGDGAHIMLFKRDVSKDSPSMSQSHVDVPIGCTCSGKGTCEKCKEMKLSTKPSATFKSLVDKMLSLFGETDVAKRTAAIEEIQKEAVEISAAAPGALPVPGALPAAAPPVHPAAAPAAPAAAPPVPPSVKDFLTKAIMECGAGPFPAGHPVHALKALLDQMSPAVPAAPVPAATPAAPAPPVAKGDTTVDAEVAKRMTDLEKRATDAEAAVLVEKNLRLDREMTDILKGFKATPFDLAKDVAVYRKMKEDDPAAFERTMAILRATDAQLAGSDLFKNIGSPISGGADGSAWAQIEAKADALLEKSADATLTREQAIEKVMFANPKLVKMYRDQQQ